MCVTVQAFQDFIFADLLRSFCTFTLHYVFVLSTFKIHTCCTLDLKWKYDVATQQNLEIRAAVRTAVPYAQGCRSITGASSMITYNTLYFQLFPFLCKGMLLTTTTLLLLEGSEKGANRTSTFMSSSLLWGH